MNTSITIAQFELQKAWLLQALADISEEEANKAPGDHLNPVKWVAGHVLNTRMSLLTLLSGHPQEPDYNRFFGKGSSGQIDDSFPTLEVIIRDWNRISTELVKCLHELTAEKLAASPPFQTSIPDRTLHGLIAYMVVHESFHIGQLSVLRKLLGKKAM